MNMNTGRGIDDTADDVIIDKDDIWSLENLSRLIDVQVDGCDMGDERPDVVDTESLRPVSGGSFAQASCVAVRKMIMFATEALSL